MLRPRAGLALLLVSLLLLTPLGQAQDSISNPSVSTPTTLYFHIFDTFNKFVINTQPMDSEFFEVGGANFFTLRDTPVNQAWPIVSNQDPNAEPVDWDFNTIYGISTAGPVEYDFDENGQPRFHPEPGIASDVKIDGSVVPVVTLYATVRDVFGTEDSPNAVVDYTFRIAVREGDDPGRETDTLDAGRLIMSGQRTFHVAHAGACDPVFGDTCVDEGNAAATGQSDPVNEDPVVVPDEDGIVEFRIPLDNIAQNIIPKKEAFNIRIDGYQASSTDAVEEDQFSEGYLRFYADPRHLPRLDFAITNPIYVEFVHPQVAADSLLIHAGVNSPWGTYDVDVANVTISIDGPMEVKESSLTKIITANTHVHGLHDQAAEITYLWKFRNENAPVGDYTITFSVNNMGHKDADGNVVTDSIRVATAKAGFVLSEQEAFGVDTEGGIVKGTGTEEVDTPNLGVVPVLGILVAALAVANRRRNA